MNLTKSKLLATITTPFDVFNINQNSSSILTPVHRKLVVDSNFGHPADLLFWKDTFDSTVNAAFAATELCKSDFLEANTNQSMDSVSLPTSVLQNQSECEKLS